MSDFQLNYTGEQVNTAVGNGLVALTTTSEQVLDDATQQIVRNKIGVQSAAETNAALLTKAPAIVENQSGNLVSTTDASSQLAVDLVSQIEPIQSGSGDPSPDNVRPISGWDSVTVQRAGKNILFRTGTLPLTRNGVTFADAGNGKISVSGTATANANFSICSYSAGSRTRIAAGTYTLTGGDANARITLVVYASQDATESVATATSFSLTQGAESVLTVPDGGGYFGLYVTVSNGKTADCVLAPQIEVGSTAGAYEPYNAETLTANLPETVYGGSLDWVTGVLTVDKEKVVIDGNNLKVKTVYQNNDGIYYASLGLPKDSLRTNVTPGNPMSDKLVANSRVVLGGCYITGSGNHTLVITLPDQTLTTVDSMNEWLSNNPITIVYALAEPYTIQLTPQQLDLLKGVNNLWSDTGDTALTYVADTTLYINQKLAAIATAALNN